MGASMQPALMQQQQQQPDAVQAATDFREDGAAPLDLAEDDQEVTVAGGSSTAANEGVVSGKGKGKAVNKSRKVEVTLLDIHSTITRLFAGF